MRYVDCLRPHRSHCLQEEGKRERSSVDARDKALLAVDVPHRTREFLVAVVVARPLCLQQALRSLLPDGLTSRITKSGTRRWLLRVFCHLLEISRLEGKFTPPFLRVDMSIL